MHRRLSLLSIGVLLVAGSVAAAERADNATEFAKSEKKAERTCGTRSVTEDEADAMEAYTEMLVSRRGAEERLRVETNATTSTVNVYFHVITTTSGTGAVSDTMIANQIRVLNDAYSGLTGGAVTKFRFVLAGTDRTANNTWFAAGPGSAA